MKILMVTSELAPLAKTGGLADAVAGLARALGTRGHEVVVLLPGYAHLPPTGAATRAYATERARFVELEDPATPYRVCLLDAPEFRDSDLYLGDVRDAARFLALARGALELGEALDFQADVIHCHDWHAALTTALARAARIPASTILTLHNVTYQGAFALHDAPAEPLFQQLHRGGMVNFLASGVRHADIITTVSPTHAREILADDVGADLQQDLRARQDDLVGILNGVDYGVWSPESDPWIRYRYTANDLRPKAQAKRALRKQVGLPADGRGPLLGLVSRLNWNKGIDLLVHALPTLLERTDASFVVLGSGEDWLARDLHDAAAAAPDRVAFVEGYDEVLSHRIFAGSDFILVPSRHEPCGLTQLYALRYGSIPIVHKTGGLADSIRHFDPVTGQGTGSVFEDADVQGLIWGATTAVGWYRSSRWRQLRRNVMEADFSWESSVPDYEAVYARGLTARAILAA